MRVIALLIACAALSGCAGGVVSSSPRTVVVRAHVQDYSGAQGLADAECAKHGRYAKLVERPGRTTAEFIFDCVN